VGHPPQNVLARLPTLMILHMKKKEFDVFISYASEARAGFVEPLAIALRRRGLKVWFDIFELRVGDSLRVSIERGLAKSKFGIVVFSPTFFKKNWPKAELNGLFAKEMAGKKNRILPILHEVKIRELLSRYPIQADKYALLSTVPTDELCEALIRVIKPELLELDTLKRMSLDAADSFLRSAQEKYPGYEFSVTTGFPADKSPILSKSRGSRVEMRIANPAALRTPPTMKVSFVGEGASKAYEYLRTGRPQTWQPGEISSLHHDIPFIPSFDSKDLIFSVGAAIDPNPRPVRVEIGNPADIVFELMTMAISRRGFEEIEQEIKADNEPLVFTIVYSPSGATEFQLSLSWTFSGFSAWRSERAVGAIDSILRGSPIRIVDLREDQPILELPVNPSPPESDPFGPDARKLISLCGQIEEHFNVRFAMRFELTEQDKEELRVLDCLLNQKEFAPTFSATLQVEKANGERLQNQLAAMQGTEFSAFYEVSNFAGAFEVFGTKIPADSWGISSRCVFEVSKLDKKAFEDGPEGFSVSCRVRAVGTATLVWAEEGKRLVASV
jgi:hypothetical protein